MSRAKQILELLEASAGDPNRQRIDALKQQIAGANKKIADMRAQHDNISRAPNQKAQNDRFHNQIGQIIQQKQSLQDEVHRLTARH